MIPLEQIIAEIEATPEGREELRQARIRLAQNLGPTYSGYDRLMRGEGPPEVTADTSSESLP